MKKRILNALLTSFVLLVVICIQSIPAIAAQQPAGATIKSLYIDKSVISNGLDTHSMEKLPSEGDGWKYDINTNTITLSDFKGTAISVEGFMDDEWGNSILTDNKSLTIELVGKSVIDEHINIINVDVKIKGNGSLKVNNVNAYNAPFWVREGDLQLSGSSKVEVTGAKEGINIETDIRGGKLIVDKGCTLVAKTTAEGDSSKPGIAIKCESIKAGGTIIGETAVGKAYNKGIWVSHECFFDAGITLKAGATAKSLKTVDLFKISGNNYIDSHNASQYMEISSYKEAKKLSSQGPNTIVNKNSRHYGSPEFTKEDYLYKITKRASSSIPGEVTVYSRYSDINIAVIPAIVKNDATKLKYKITAVGERAFYKCEKLISVTLPKGVIIIEKLAFQDCKRLRTVNLPEGVTVIENEAFFWCRSLKNVKLPSTLKKLGDGVFYANQVESFTVPKGVTELSTNVFAANISLKTVILPTGLTKVGSGAFAGCHRLKGIVIPEKVSNIGVVAFSDCFSLTKINIPQGITRIEENLFQGCSGLSSIVIPQKVTSIGRDAFRSCKRLTVINLPNKVKSIGEGAFWGCSNLQKVNIPVGVTKLENNLFSDCQNLAAIEIPKGVTSIGNHAFSKCESLEKVAFPEGVKIIGRQAFYSCLKLADLTIPKSVNQINSWAFKDTKWLENQKIQNKFIIINGILLYAGVTDESEGGYITIPESVKEIGCDAFQYSNVTGVTFPKGIARIGDSAFSNCVNLLEINIPSGVTDIGDHAFDGCTKLASVSLPESVTNIGYSAFAGCSFKSIKLPKNLKILGNEAFNSCAKLESITVPGGIKVVEYNTFFNCTSLKTVVIEKGIEEVSGFFQCYTLESVTLPNTVKLIFSEAFTQCPNLKSIYIPESVTNINDTGIDKGAIILCKKDSYAHNWAKKYGFNVKLK